MNSQSIALIRKIAQEVIDDPSIFTRIDFARKAPLVLQLLDRLESLTEALEIALNQFAHAKSQSYPGECIEGCAKCFCRDALAAHSGREKENGK